MNSVGEGARSNERSATPVAPATVPGAPTLSSATGRQRDCRARLERAASDGGSAITGYKVYRGTSTGGETLLTTLGNVTRVDGHGGRERDDLLLPGLRRQLGRRGRALERALRDAGRAGDAPGAPTLRSATAGNGSVALAWSAPGSDGGSAITGYKVYRGTSTGGETLLDDARQRHELDGHSVANGTTYYYQVSAVNSVGEGPLERALRHPGRARDRAGRADAQLGHGRERQRRARLERAGFGRRRGDHRLQGLPRHLERRRDAADDARQRDRLDGQLRRQRDTYYYQVSAVNSVGEGARSNERSATPAAPATVPGAPTLSSATARQRHASRSPGARRPRTAARRSRATRSTAAPRPAARRCSRPSATSPAGRTRSVVNGTTYYYQVSAVNSVGEGALSNERSATPAAPRRRPARRRSNSATAGNGSVALAWSAPVSTAARRSPATRSTAAPRRRRDAADDARQRHQLDGRHGRERDDLLLPGLRRELGRRGRAARTSAPRRRSAPATAPGAPTLSSATAGNGSVALAWSAPLERRLGDHGLQGLPRHLERRRDAAHDRSAT